MRSVIYLLVFGILVPVAGAHEDIPTYYMHDLCGQSVNLRRESVFTAKIEFQPSALFNRTRPTDGLDDSGGKGPSDLCQYEDTRLRSSSFTTTDKDLSLRFHGSINADKNAVIRAVIVAFHSGTCMSYEHPCLNGHCIMQDLVCNGHNPCGDFNDCPRTPPPQDVTDNEEDNVTGFAIICASVSVAMLMLAGAIVVFVFYHKRHSRACNCHHREFISGSTAEHRLLATNPSALLQSQPIYERTISQIEAERRFAPPSYSQLPVIENEAESKNEHLEPDPPEDENPPIEMNLDRCLEPDYNRPPSYICVMLHQDEYKLSEPNIHSHSSNRGFFTNNKPKRTHFADHVYQRT